MKWNCAPHEYKKDVFVLTLEDEPWKEIHASIFGKKPILEFSDQNLEKQFFDWELKQAKNFVLRRLAKRSYSSFELIKILEERLVSKQAALETIHYFQKAGYIDDEDWMERFLHLHLKKQGPHALLMKLKSKGIPEDFINERLLRLDDLQPQSNRIQELLKTKYHKKDLSDFKERQKVISALMRRGFDYDEIISSF